MNIREGREPGNEAMCEGRSPVSFMSAVTGDKKWQGFSVFSCCNNDGSVQLDVSWVVMYISHMPSRSEQPLFLGCSMEGHGTISTPIEQ